MNNIEQMNLDVRTTLRDMATWRAEVDRALKKSQGDMRALAQDTHAWQSKVHAMENQITDIKSVMSDLQDEMRFSQSAFADVRQTIGELEHAMNASRQHEHGMLSEVETLRRETSEAASALARDVAALAEDARTLRGWCKSFDSSVDQRIRAVEASPSLDVLSKKLNELSSQQSRSVRHPLPSSEISSVLSGIPLRANSELWSHSL